ncbi:isoprenylcysteine carboxylmethyltransferase family protein [Candidatus Curtissbacteria bacterium]|nr:isoprenylcysteine carboxylmethyltransferase family protein [Candidatus Curtissbacteria bacterium]
MHDNRWIIYLQVIFLGLLFFLGDLGNIAKDLVLSLIFGLGAGILVAGFFNIGIKSYSPYPEPREGRTFQQKGLYRYVRHPMYTGMVVMGLGLVLSQLRLESFLIWLFLIYVLNLKADMEEVMLIAKHPEYADYKNKTKKFIPYIL